VRISFRQRRLRPRAYVVGAIAAGVLALTAGIASSANYDTYYCGTATTWCVLGSGQYESTAGVALRDNDYTHCATNCHVHNWYYNTSLGSYNIVHSNGTQDAVAGAGSGAYAYSRCETDSGYGSNNARCHTPWHT
jgi:hypothetical protein